MSFYLNHKPMSNPIYNKTNLKFIPHQTHCQPHNTKMDNNQRFYRYVMLCYVIKLRLPCSSRTVVGVGAG